MKPFRSYLLQRLRIKPWCLKLGNSAQMHMAAVSNLRDNITNESKVLGLSPVV